VGQGIFEVQDALQMQRTNFSDCAVSLKCVYKSAQALRLASLRRGVSRSSRWRFRNTNGPPSVRFVLGACPHRPHVDERSAGSAHASRGRPIANNPESSIKTEVFAAHAEDPAAIHSAPNSS